jgi:hypothetical protein
VCQGARSQEGSLELEWVQQILHNAPGGGRATLRSHALATHEAEPNDGVSLQTSASLIRSLLDLIVRSFVRVPVPVRSLGKVSN